jgi:hypothetical protein
VVLVSSPTVSSVPIYNIYIHTVIFMYSYMYRHTTILPYRSIRLYIIFRINISMGSGAFPVKVATTVATLAISLAMTTMTMTKQSFGSEDTKHCNMYDPSYYNLEYKDSREAWRDEITNEQ